MGKKLLRDRYEFWDRLPLMGSAEKNAEINEDTQITQDEVKITSELEPLNESKTAIPTEKDEL